MDSEDLQRLAWGAAGLALIVFLIRLRAHPAYRREEGLQARLLKRTFLVVSEDPQTLVFILGAALLGLGPAALIVRLMTGIGGSWGLDALYALFCLLCLALSSFASAAVVACSVKRLLGRPPSLRDGVEAMARNAPALLAWSLATAALMTGLNALARRLKGFSLWARISQSLWLLANLFFVPVVVVEGLGFWEAVRRSEELVRSRFSRTGGLAVMKETAGTLLITTAVLSLFTAVGALVVHGLVWELWPGDADPLRELTRLAWIPLVFLFAGGAVLADLYLVLLSAVYLHLTGDERQRLAVERRLPRELLLEPFPMLGTIARPAGALLEDADDDAEVG